MILTTTHPYEQCIVNDARETLDYVKGVISAMNKAILIVPSVLLMRPGQNTRGSNMEFCSKNDDTTATSEIVSAPSASSSRADSVSAAKSQNNVRCFAFCLGCPQLIRAQPQIRTVE